MVVLWCEVYCVRQGKAAARSGRRRGCGGLGGWAGEEKRSGFLGDVEDVRALPHDDFAGGDHAIRRNVAEHNRAFTDDGMFADFNTRVDVGTMLDSDSNIDAGTGTNANPGADGDTSFNINMVADFGIMEDCGVVAEVDLITNGDPISDGYIVAMGYFATNFDVIPDLHRSSLHEHHPLSQSEGVSVMKHIQYP